jgi:hypothetical protein
VAALLGLDENLVDRNVVVLVVATSVILPICLMRDISSLAWTSFLSVLADVVRDQLFALTVYLCVYVCVCMYHVGVCM